MNNLHLLRYCAAVLCVCVLPGCISVDMTTLEDFISVNSQTATQTVTPSVTSGTSQSSPTMTTATVITHVDASRKTPPVGPISTTDAAPPTANFIPTDAPKAKFVWRECVSVLMVTGGLIVGCTILLVTTLMLVWKVCQLKRRLRVLGSHDDLISNSEYWIGTARKNKSKHKSEAVETSMLMTGFSQTQELRDNKAGQEDQGTATREGQKEEEKKDQDTVQSGEVLTHAPQINSENPKEEKTNVQVNNVESTSAEGKEETKAVL